MSAHSNTELEFKLAGAPRDIARVRAWLEKAGAPGGCRERFVSTGYDTPDGDLARHSINMWVRRENGRTIREVEVAQNASPLPGPVDDILHQYRQTTAPTRRIVIDRWTTRITGTGATIDIFTDDGVAERLVNGEVVGRETIGEIDFRHISGNPRPIFVLARKMIKASGGRLRLSVLSKRERAENAGKAYIFGKAKKINLDTNGIASDALRAALHGSARRLSTIAPKVYDGRLPEAARQLRIALRRFRSVERAFRRAAKSKKLLLLSDRARTFAQILGAARDWDVFLTETLAEFDEQTASPGFLLLRQRAEALRAEAWERAAAAIGGQEFSLFVFEVMMLATLEDWRYGARFELFDPTQTFAARALERRLAKAMTVGESLTQVEPEAGHPLRLQIKKLRYAAQTFRDLYPKSARKPYFSAMSGLQDGFGRLNDAVVAQRLAHMAAIGQGPDAAQAAGVVIGYRSEEARRVLPEIMMRWQEFVAARPFWRPEN